MTAINNLAGHIVKDGKVVYSEQLEPGLHFAVIIAYDSVYDKPNCKFSSSLLCQAVITTGKRIVWGNGVASLEDAEYNEYGDYKPLRELKTKDGHRVWQGVVQLTQNSRQVKWLVEVPKKDLLKLCGIEL